MQRYHDNSLPTILRRKILRRKILRRKILRSKIIRSKMKPPPPLISASNPTVALTIKVSGFSLDPDASSGTHSTILAVCAFRLSFTWLCSLIRCTT